MGYTVALDVGGTFTDVALVHEASGRLWVTKTSTTPHDVSAGFIAGIDKALRLAGVEAASLRHVLHGTTTATNAILEGKGAATGLRTTAGFRYVLEIGRHDIPRRANMFAWVKPARPVSPELIFEIGGRVTVEGEELEPLDETGVRAAARRLREAGVNSIAVCFLHSYANPAHERRAHALLLDEHPGGAVSLSSEVLPVFREFERSMGTVLNAYVQPLVAGYVARLVGELRARGITAPLSIMKSNGGVIGADVVRTQAIHTALSGPAAGVIGVRRIGEAAGFADLISVDVGGTSADVCLVRGGEAEVTVEGRVGAWPLHVPMLDIHTIGPGGAGPLHGAELAALLAMRTVVVPRHPGVLSTFGLLGTEVRNDYARTSLQKPPDYDLGAVGAVYAALEGQARAWLAAEGVEPAGHRLTRLADLRYRHQGFELTVPWPEPDLSVDALVARFHERHRQLYTYALADAPVEIVTLRVAAAGRVRRFTLPSLDRRGAAAAQHSRRRVYFAGVGWKACPCIDRERLGVGAVVTGPAIVEQLDTTTVVPPGHRATVDRVGNLVIRAGARRPRGPRDQMSDARLTQATHGARRPRGPRYQ